MRIAINSFLMNLSSSIRTTTWYAFIVLLVVVACILTGIYCYKIRKLPRDVIVCLFLSFASFAVVIIVALFIESITNDKILLSGVTYYIPYLFGSSYVLSKYLHCTTADVTDLVALAYLPGRAINIIGCTIAGCCQGVPASWGLYSAILKTNVVPVQLYESIAIWIIWFILDRWYHKKHFSQNGKCALLSLVLFGGLNVFTDIFTYIQEKIIYMLSVEGIFAFITMCIGLLLLYVTDKKYKTDSTSAQET